MNRTPSSTNTPKTQYSSVVAAAQPQLSKKPPHNSQSNQRQQQQQQRSLQQSAAVVPATASSSLNGKSSKTQPQQTSTTSNGNTSRSVPPIKTQAQKNASPVQFPTSSTASSPIQFGSINQSSINQSSTNPPLSTSPIQNPSVTGGKIPLQPSKSSALPTFGTVARGTTEELVRPQQNPVNSPTGANTYSGPGRPRIQDSRTHPASQLNLQESNQAKNGTQSAGQQPPVVTSHQSSTTATSHQSTTSTHSPQSTSTPRQHSSHTSHEQSLHRKDSSNVSYHQNNSQYNNYTHYQHHRQHKGPSNPQNFPGQFHNQRARDKPIGGHIPPSPHLNPAAQQAVSNPSAAPMMMPSLTPINMWPPPYRPHGAYSYYEMPYMYQMPAQQYPQPRVPVNSIQPSSHVNQQATTHNIPQRENKAVKIVNPNTMKEHDVSNNSGSKKEEASIVVAADTKKSQDSEKEDKQSSDQKGSKAVKIINPAEKGKEDQERREKEEHEKKVWEEEKKKEEREREERERKEEERVRKEREERERKEKEEREEQERKEKEERERKEKEEQERKEREERERKEKEERERKEREERERKEKEERERKEREERERKEREERERKEREEQERKEKEERERKEKEERERKEREERERKEKEERERKEREERERKEKEERERKEREERERKEREERERKEREERERKEREEREQKEKEERERKEKEEQERKEKEEKERREAEKKKEEATAEESGKKREVELKDTKEKKFGRNHRPEHLDLSKTINPSAPVSTPLGSALESARMIDDINSMQYPGHIKSPAPELNANAEPRKYKYDRVFLMQFMDFCKDKPDNLPALDAIGMEESKDDKKRPGNSRSNSGTGSSRGGSQHKGSPNQTPYSSGMGEFKVPAKNSEERFAQSTMRLNISGNNFGRSTLGQRSYSGNPMLPSGNVMAGNAGPSSPGRSSAGSRVGSGGGGARDRQDRRKGHVQPGAPTIPMDQVAPLEHSENRWVPSVVSAKDDIVPLESVQRKVKALLNKLTLEKFDSISDQIIDHANQSRDEKDGRILKTVIQLTFLKACDEPNFSQMYAQLCRKMMERIDPEIVDEGVKNNENKYVQGGALFRKYLLNRCQEDFEKGWKVNVPVPSNEEGEPDLLSDEYYVAQKAKRMGLGLIKFIGELFKLNMLTERIMHECVKKLLYNVSNPEEEETESLCKLLTTVGKLLDHSKAKEHVDTYFARMEPLTKNNKISSRIRFMLMDVIDLRENNWTPRRDLSAPKTIAQIHEDAAKQKEEAEYMRRTASSGGRLPRMTDQLSRGGSGRRDNKGGSTVPLAQDGWNTVPSPSARKTGDLSKFGTMPRSKVSGNLSLAPGGQGFAGGSKGWKQERSDRDDQKTTAQPNRSTPIPANANTYSVLTHAEQAEGRKSLDGAPHELQKAPSSSSERPKLQLLPRGSTLPAGSSSSSKSAETKPSSTTPTKVTSEAEADRKIKSMLDEFWSVLDNSEVSSCIQELPPQYQSRALQRILESAIEKKQGDVDNASKLFTYLYTESKVTKADFIKAFTDSIETLKDISLDVPHAYLFRNQLLVSAHLDTKDIPIL